MLHFKSFIVCALVVFCTTTALAETKLARSNARKGLTTVYLGEGKNFPSVGTLPKDDLFYCTITNSEWLKIVALKWQNAKQIEGYIHKSKVQFIETLPSKTQKKLLSAILVKQKTLADNFQKAWRTKDSILYKTTIQELEAHSEFKYTPILEILPQYFCTTKDTTTLQLFFSTLWADKGAADEAPSFAVANCFICHTNIILRQLRALKTNEQRNTLYDYIGYGLVNHYSIDRNGKSENAEYNLLKKILDKEREERP